jgi:hypothetical protein
MVIAHWDSLKTVADVRPGGYAWYVTPYRYKMAYTSERMLKLRFRLVSTALVPYRAEA